MCERIKKIKKMLDIIKVTDWSQIDDRIDEIKSILDNIEKPKRKPLSDGTLLLTDSELEEFDEKFERYKTESVKLSGIYVRVWSLGQYSFIADYKATLWLNERFELTEK
jgi:hypothetical protein